MYSTVRTLLVSNSAIYVRSIIIIVTIFNPFLSCLGDLPQTVLKAVVGSTRVDKVADPKLLEVAQSLELRGVDDGHTQRVEFHVTMHWVVEHLKNSTTHWSPKLPVYVVILDAHWIYFDKRLMKGPEEKKRTTDTLTDRERETEGERERERDRDRERERNTHKHTHTHTHTHTRTHTRTHTHTHTHTHVPGKSLCLLRTSILQYTHPWVRHRNCKRYESLKDCFNTL